uniref:Ig-like domain-containing protein n=1 Tax=Paramormyrops kingsleyae TaxID=1676925 RepID=A0A3B3RBT7_9TELE
MFQELITMSSVRRVTVQSGGSVTIPCLYEDIYKNHVKYWCRGSDWRSCTTIVRTDSPQKKGDVSIRDDPEQRFFTVTMNNLRTGDSGYYWCSVEIICIYKLYLAVVPTGADSVSSVRRVTVQSGGSVTIPCLYEDRYKNHMKYWCKGDDGQSCTSIVRTDFPQKKGDVSIRDDPEQQVFTVTMNNLKIEDNDTYWCRVEISGHSDDGEWVTLSVSDGKMSVVHLLHQVYPSIVCIH